MTDLSIIIVSWNVASLLHSCLESIRASLTAAGSPDTEIIVVDSNSADDTIAHVRTHFPEVTLLPQNENVGFTRGNNIGLAIARGRHLLLLNPDTEIVGDALKQMVNALDADPTIGIAGPHTLNNDGTTQSSRRRFPTWLTGAFESTWLQPYAPKALLDRFYVRDVADDVSLADVDWVQGSALMARREVYERIGGLDDGYIMYSEELDWCKRAKLAGWRVVYLGRASIVHHGGKSTEQAPARTQIYFQQSKLRYFRKYHGALSAQTLRLVLFANYGAQLLIESAKWLLGHKRDLRRARVQTYWQVIRSGLKVTA